MKKFPTEFEVPLGKRTIKYRFFEILPGVISWSLILLPIVLSIIDPTSRLAAVFVLFFMISWFYRAIGMAFRTVQGYTRMQRAKKSPWSRWLDDLNDPEAFLERVDSSKKRLSGVTRQHIDNIREYVSNPQINNLRVEDVHHLVIVPMWKEAYEVLEPTLQSLKKAVYKGIKMTVVIAFEERGGLDAKKTALRLVEEFGKDFYYMEAIEHPDGIKNEVVGKGGNITWAARRILKRYEKEKVSPDRVMVTTLDADNHTDKNYFSHLTYSYILTHDRKRHSYQPLALYTNNIWDVPAPMRVLAVGNSFFTIVQSARPHLLRNFSSHSQSLDALIETNFWSTRTIVEDGHQYWRSYFAFGGNYGIVPIYSPIYQDAVLSDTYKATLKDQFTQIKRWTYGASDIPYIANLGLRLRSSRRVVPIFDITMKFFRLLDTHVSWATVSLILLLAARIPLLIGPQADRSIVAHQLPIIASYAQSLALGGLFISIFLSLKLLPPRPERYKKRRSFLMLLQWVLLPFTSIIYGSFAALYSQTRLALGRYMEKFDLTHKGIKS